MVLLPGRPRGPHLDPARQCPRRCLQQVDDELRDILREQIHMLHRQHRQLQPGHAAHLARPKPAAIDDMLALHGAMFGDDIPQPDRAQADMLSETAAMTLAAAVNGAGAALAPSLKGRPIPELTNTVPRVCDSRPLVLSSKNRSIRVSRHPTAFSDAMDKYRNLLAFISGLNQLK